MRRYIFILFCFACVIIGMHAQPARVPARHGVIIRKQPNGDTLHTYLRGDERWHVMLMVDGWQIMETSEGKLYYAKNKTRIVKGEGKKQVAVISRRMAHDADKRSKCEQRWLNKHGVQLFKND